MSSINLDLKTLVPGNVSLTEDGVLNVKSDGRNITFSSKDDGDPSTIGAILRLPGVFVHLAGQGQASVAVHLIDTSHPRTDARFGAYHQLRAEIIDSVLPRELRAQALRELEKVAPAKNDLAHSLGGGSPLVQRPADVAGQTSVFAVLQA